ncbi:MAG TPA: UDP-2,4-diacetamido-2,4,6-trideoxy-beta-L-altropyranose hydrolase, partial [Caulobacteraceae bacterium]|nr:UDP-2,4-diacetamido-2,4,6-trideoxy-beta-L-altropyranose hydrolase [Caulobacteraceae bacterium]
MAAPRILFLADAGPQVGGGHVMRCLTLARALAAKGAECAFVESRSAASVLRRFGWPEQTVLAMATAEDPPGLVRWAERFAGTFEPDVVVVDHYRLGAAEQSALRDGERAVVVIDDLADRRHDCDLLVDPGYGRRREDYAELVRPTCQVLVGPDVALVRPEFAAARARAVSRRARHEPVRRVLVSLGLTDVGAITARVVEALAPHLGEVRLDVALGSGAPSLDALSSLAAHDRRVRLHIDTDDMAMLTAEADAAIGAGGSSVWERATVALPSLVVVLADNQAPMAARLGEAGAAIALDAREPGFEAALAAAWDRLIDDAPLRWSLGARASE